uniref:CPG4 domain-containing protein n=1 Tax=Loa loa TaxID=7209 RepID=A0A1I7VZR4_LOALO
MSHIIVVVPLLAQIPPQPIATTNSACLNDCLKEGSLVFAASNLRNFRKIILHIEEFCDTREQLLKCIQSCTDEEREELAKKTSLSEYICSDKLEEFRLVKECMENQEDIDSVSKCSNECGHPSDATIQLDSSPAAPVNPFAFIDSITQVCRTIECTIKCSITESNKICAGSGYLFRDIGFKQVLESSDKLENDAFNSSSATQQLTKIYLESLPKQCTFIINPTNYKTTFAEHEANDESGIGLSETSEIERNTVKPSSISDEERMKQTTSEMFNTNSDSVITRIFDAQLTTKATEMSRDDDTMEEMGKEAVELTAKAEVGDESDVAMESSTFDNVASTVESADSPSMKSETSVQIQTQPTTSHESHEITEQEEEESTVSTVTSHEQEEKEEEENESAIIWASKKEETTTVAVQESDEKDEEIESSDVMAHLQHLSTPATAQEMTERTIVVVNDDEENEIDTNSIIQRTAAEQKDATKQGVCERITLSLLLILPSISLYLSNQLTMHVI